MSDFDVQPSGKRRLDGYDTVCVWCYTITNKQKFKKRDKWGIDFYDVDIEDPALWEKVPGAPKYKLHESGKETVVYREIGDAEDGKEQLEICFIAGCKEQRKQSVSLEARRFVASGGAMVETDWEIISLDGSPDGRKQMPGPWFSRAEEPIAEPPSVTSGARASAPRKPAERSGGRRPAKRPRRPR